MEDSDIKLSMYRKEINALDDEMVALFLKRMDIAGKIGEVKKQAGLPVLNVKREEEVKERLLKNVPEDKKEYVSSLYDTVFLISKTYQGEINK